MLVISRSVGEIITIGDDIFIKVLAITGNTVRFGIEAPKEVEVHRLEVYQRILAKLARGEKATDQQPS